MVLFFLTDCFRLREISLCLWLSQYSHRKLYGWKCIVTDRRSSLQPRLSNDLAISGWYSFSHIVFLTFTLMERIFREDVLVLGNTMDSTSAGVVKIANAIKGNPKTRLNVLSLFECRLQSEAAIAIAEALEWNSSLEVLDLSSTYPNCSSLPNSSSPNRRIYWYINCLYENTRVKNLSLISRLLLLIYIGICEMSSFSYSWMLLSFTFVTRN